MNYYFSYAIRCIIRRIIYFLTKPKYLLIIVTSIIVIFLLSNYTNVFGYEGDNSYTDKNATILACYDSIASDLVNRMQTSPNSLLDSYLTDGQYSYYLYYGSADGGDMLSAQQWNTNYLYIAVYKTSSRTITATAQDRYQGMTTNIYYVTNIYDLMRYNGNIFEVPSVTNGQYIPSPLLSYHSSIITNYYNNSTASATQSITSAINNQTNTIQQQTNTIQQQTTVIQETQDFLENDTVQDSTMTIDTSGMTVNDNGVNNFFTTFINSVYNLFNNIDSTVETISIPMPFNMPDIVLRSDIISSHISNTILFTLIQTFWWFVLSRYIIYFVFRMIKWLSDGELAERGVFAFADWLDNYNAIIKSYMM